MQIQTINNTNFQGAKFAPTTKALFDAMYFAAKTGTLQDTAKKLQAQYPSAAKEIQSLLYHKDSTPTALTQLNNDVRLKKSIFSVIA